MYLRSGCAPDLGLMAFELVTMRRSCPRQAWEMGPAIDPFPDVPTARMCALTESVGEAVVPRRKRGRRGSDGTAARRKLTGNKKKSGPPPGLADAKEREAVVAKWVVILQIPAEYGAMPGKAKGNEMNYVVVECLVVKSAKVLQLRAG